MATIEQPLKGQRLTRKKTHAPGHRIMLKSGIEIKILTLGHTTDITGTIIDRLGEYEDIGTIEELKRLKETYKKFVKK